MTTDKDKLMRKKNILIVEDDKIILDSLREFLYLEGFQTSGAESFRLAVTKLQKQNYSLVIADVNLPDGDGFELFSNSRHRHNRLWDY